MMQSLVMFFFLEFSFMINKTISIRGKRAKIAIKLLNHDHDPNYSANFVIEKVGSRFEIKLILY